MLISKNWGKVDLEIVKDETMILFLNDHRKLFFYKKFVTSVMTAFITGLIIGVFVLPAIGLNNSLPLNTSRTTQKSSFVENQNEASKDELFHTMLEVTKRPLASGNDFENNFKIKQKHLLKKSNSSTPTIDYYSVSFLKVQDKSQKNAMFLSRDTRKKSNGKAVATKTQKVASPNILHLQNSDKMHEADDVLLQRYKLQRRVKSASALSENFEKQNDDLLGLLINDIYWGPTIEEYLPVGSSKQALKDWKTYVDSNTTRIIKIEHGCGRMQNRLVTFSDGVKACAR